METVQLMKMLDEVYPDRIPLYELEPFDYGVLVGQRLLIEKLKERLKIEEIVTDDK